MSRYKRGTKSEQNNAKNQQTNLDFKLECGVIKL